MSIITISREFGSDGRELGKLPDDIFHFAYYDKEIILASAEESNLAETYVEEMMEIGLSHSCPITVGRTFYYPAFLHQNTTNMLVQQKIIKALAAKGDCVVAGQSADTILWGHMPFNLFVYADLFAKLKRCRERAPEGECLTDRT